MSTNSNSVNISINEEYLEGKDNFDIISLFGKKVLEEIQTVISDVTGIAFVTVDYKGEPVTTQTRFTKFCKKMREDDVYSILCKLSDASGSITAATTKETSIYFCPYGLLEVAIPIIVNGKYLGGFIGGQVICKDAPDNLMRLSKNMVPGGGEMKELDIFSSDSNIDLSDSREYTYSEFVSISKLVELIINQLTKQELISGHNKMKNLGRIRDLEEKNKVLKYENNVYKNSYLELKRHSDIFFTRNTLNIISNLALMEDANETNKAILKYYELINSENENKYFTIRNELQRVEKLIDINRLRYIDKINYSVKFDEDILDIKMPLSIILPFAHFSLYYSLTSIEREYFLEINVMREKSDIKIEILDNGPGLNLLDLEVKYKIYGEEHEGYVISKSIKSISKSLIDNFGEKYKVQFECKKDQGCKIILRYPINFEEGI